MSASPRWLLTLLAVSLTLNLVGLGWIAGRLSMGGQAGAFDLEYVDEFRLVHDLTAEGAEAGLIGSALSEDPGSGLRWMLEGLPPDRRRMIEVEIEAEQTPILGEVREVVVLRDEVREELARTRFEKENLEAALARLREQVVAVQADSHRVLVDFAATLTEEERAALAARLEARYAGQREHDARMPGPEIHVYTRRLMTEDARTETEPAPPE